MNIDITIVVFINKLYFSENHSPLRPVQFGKELSLIQSIESIIGNIPIGALSLGSFIHEDLKLSPKPPFIGPIRGSCLSEYSKISII